MKSTHHLKLSEIIVNIVDDFQKTLHCACAIKIPIATGRVNIRICRDITGEMWFGVGYGYEVIIIFIVF